MTFSFFFTEYFFKIGWKREILDTALKELLGVSVVFPHFPKTPLTLAIYSLSSYLMGSPPPVCGVKWWVEAASSLSQLVKGVSHQVGLSHICASTPPVVGSHPLNLLLLIIITRADPSASYHSKVCITANRITLQSDSHVCQCFSSQRSHMDLLTDWQA